MCESVISGSASIDSFHKRKEKKYSSIETHLDLHLDGSKKQNMRILSSHSR